MSDLYQDDLFSKKEKKIYTVAEITGYLQALIKEDALLSDFWISGEISNFYHHSSGHMYFTLKDKNSQLKTVMFKGYNSSLNFEPEEGMQVEARGNLDIYAQRGEYQFYAREMEKAGKGKLYEAFEKLKARLEKEGLFAEAKKKEIPLLARKIGIVTSPTGAAIRDILSVMKRRSGNFSVLIVPSHVQGDLAKGEITAGIEYLNSRDDIDLIIISRGGGSIEDLWPFNEEEVARAIYNSRLPVISGVGHETDFTISDFVADLRAPTPSAAAELATANREEILNRLDNLTQRLLNSSSTKIKELQNRLQSISERRIFASPEELFRNYEQELDSLETKLKHQIEKKYNVWENNYQLLYQKLNNLSPLKTLNRGYSILQDQEEKTIMSVNQIEAGDQLQARLSDGLADLEVKACRKDGDIND
ncbi:exodeoxyribonuclease VII large subunit [Halanaerobium saccharolyticum]|uniref:Exodeoxyribonuclease 7 large subunit n=1 Tax=Halanaerobium saccharolyticum TaxID=43595 RepID=A0A4R7Z6C6_9FIRM|nr:exodeoxyribonuclease VII large subunit [Halanaerobium saccharolyticum]RAK11060.1 exodeoxyribonuclease VII large subunit [Halanaerobium saccharolyticum]TDW06911.1 exodeoxyribonuclease VII large subunit [Halanaerobium saccharolyticum]TDX63676.1 exodeoxyribonuclease VII large subunit [Halanaerobium saccharolyticum]